ncbi:MAG: exodeoxyribonuclease VII large subunit [Firmicutes bacterium]|nr:exodeoxyribonuclease VII large subunit [Bacillota bacterium]
MHRQVFTVSQVNRYVKRVLEADALLAGVFIEGELSNFHAHSSGHLYFTLKDAGAAISGVMFKSHASNLDFNPQNGMKVIAFGQLSLYEKTGQYQLYVEIFEPAGIGGLQLAFRQLSDKLQKEGLFDEERKRPIPAFVNTVAVITSPTGAAVHDIIRTIRGRNPVVKVVIVPAKVQGDGAATDLARAIHSVSAWGGADVIILGRGGGSIEDLWAFNEEILARAIAASKVPIISAVGHETDFTISDFVADMRAATPTAAAVSAVYDHRQLVSYVAGLQKELTENIANSLRNRLADVKFWLDRLSRQAKDRIGREWQNLAHHEALLEKVSPYAAFKRGYALIRTEEGTIITGVKDLTRGQCLELTWADGKAIATIEDVKNA